MAERTPLPAVHHLDNQFARRIIVEHVLTPLPNERPWVITSIHLYLLWYEWHLCFI